MTVTKSKQYPELNVGLASIPYSLDEQIQRTLHETTQSWFVIEEAWTKEIGADISLSLNSFKVKNTNGKSVKTREICLVVKTSDRLDKEAANHLFETVKEAINNSPFLDVEPWHRVDDLKERQ